jgi:hypothetical protein
LIQEQFHYAREMCPRPLYRYILLIIFGEQPRMSMIGKDPLVEVVEETPD